MTVNAPPPPKEPIQTVLTLNTIRNVPWGKDVTVTGKLADASNGGGEGIVGKTITFDGTGADNLPDVTTKTPMALSQQRVHHQIPLLSSNL